VLAVGILPSGAKWNRGSSIYILTISAFLLIGVNIWEIDIVVCTITS